MFFLYPILFEQFAVEIGKSKKNFESQKETLTHTSLRQLKCSVFDLQVLIFDDKDEESNVIFGRVFLLREIA